jgi:hypothetical protein
MFDLDVVKANGFERVLSKSWIENLRKVPG